MCGIAGWVDFSGDGAPQATQVQAMADTMALCGPDAGGLWISGHAALGHRRLAVIDPGGGRQPMIAPQAGHDDKPAVVLSYSGEVYNYRQLRDELRSRGHRFRTASDTEVVLHCYLEWGADMPRRLVGMFAFALWDARLEHLLLVRDRLGIKPLYYHPTSRGSAVRLRTQGPARPSRCHASRRPRRAAAVAHRHQTPGRDHLPRPL
jgi:asparagine synthase (glutamine-hydrolysing)